VLCVCHSITHNILKENLEHTCKRSRMHTSN
jgi:hypothetical protein